MNLYINSPSYYTCKNGVIDEIYQLCLLISHSVDVTDYSNAIETIGITPIIAPTHVISSGYCQEVKMISLSYKMANISLHSDYDKFCLADINEKKQIILENIFNSLRVIKKRLKGNFDYNGIVNEIEDIVKSQSDDGYMIDKK